MRVHSELGPGLLESILVACLQHELTDAGIRSSVQVGLPVVYRGVKLDPGYRMDLRVEYLVRGTEVRRRPLPGTSGPGAFVP